MPGNNPPRSDRYSESIRAQHLQPSIFLSKALRRRIRIWALIAVMAFSLVLAIAVRALYGGDIVFGIALIAVLICQTALWRLALIVVHRICDDIYAPPYGDPTRNDDLRAEP